MLPRGSAKEEAFVVQDGEAYLVGQVEKETFPLMILKRDDVFGNLPLMDIGHEPSKAFIAASKGLEVTKIDMGEIEGAYDQLSTTMRGLILNISTSISLTTRLAYTLNKDK